MGNVLVVIEIIGVIGIWAVIFWLTKLIANLKGGIDAQKAVIDSMSSQADYISNVHSTVSKLYDPGEIEKLVSAKTEHEISKYQGRYNDIIKKSDKDIQALYKFVGLSVTYLNANQLEDIFSKFEPEFRSPEFEKFAYKLRTEIEKIRSEALANALSGYGEKT